MNKNFCFQKSSNNSGRIHPKVFVLLIIFVSFIVLFYSQFKTSPSTVTPQGSPSQEIRKVTISSEELVKNGIHFIKSQNENGLFYANQECEEDKCDKANPEVLPAYAWSLLGGLAAISTESLGEKKWGKEILESSFEKWRSKADGSEIYSLHQLYEVFRITNEKKYMIWFWDRYSRMIKIGEHIIAKGDSIKLHPVMGFTIARQLVFHLDILNNYHEYQNQFALRNFKGGIEGLEEKKVELKKIIHGVLEWSTSQMSSFNDSPMLQDDPRFEQFACWAPWVEFELYKATKNEELLNSITLFLDTIRFRDKSLKHSVLNQQAILPCLHVIAGLPDHLWEKYEPDFIAITEQFVLPNWDLQERKLCNGDGGILASIRDESSEKCLYNKKSVSDSAWASYIYSMRLGLEYEY